MVNWLNNPSNLKQFESNWGNHLYYELFTIFATLKLSFYTMCYLGWGLKSADVFNRNNVDQVWVFGGSHSNVKRWCGLWRLNHSKDNHQIERFKEVEC